MSEHQELMPIFFNEVEEFKALASSAQKEMKNFVETLNAKGNLCAKLKKLLALNEKMDYIENCIQVQEEFFPLNEKRGKTLSKLRVSLNTFKSNLYTHEKLLHVLEYAIKSDKIDSELKGMLKNFFKVENIELNQSGRVKKLAKISNAIDKLGKDFVSNTEKLGKNLEHSIYIEKNNLRKLKGLDISYINVAKEKAKKYNRDGALFLYDESVFYTILFSVQNRDIRQQAYKLLMSANSHINKKYNNDDILAKILTHRHKMAELFDAKDYSELTISNYVLSSSKEILHYLNKAQNDLEPAYQCFLEKIKNLASKDGVVDIQPWDVFYYKGVLADDIDPQIYTNFRKYFDIDYFFKTFFKLMSKQFNLTFKEISAKEVMSGKIYNKLAEEVFCYEVIDNTSNKHGYLVLDKFASKRKKEDRFICYSVNSRHYLDDKGTMSNAVGYISLALDKSDNHLAFYEMKTIMHEFGHFLHFHFKSPSDIDLSWDLIEAPSQFLEQWMYNYETIKMLSNLNGKKLPKTIFNKMMEKEMYLDISYNYGNIEKYTKKIELHKMYKNNLEKNPSEIYQLEHHLECNIVTDLYMLSEDYQQEYAATEYVYLYSESIAFQLYKTWLEAGAHHNNEHARFLFTNVFNHSSQKKSKNVFSKFVNLKENNILELITKGLDVKLVGLN